MFESRAKINAWAGCGDDYYYGKNGEKKNYEMAVYFYEKAAAKKHPHATYMLGLCYELGQFVDMDSAHAEELYENAVALGDEDAKKRLEAGVCDDFDDTAYLRDTEVEHALDRPESVIIEEDENEHTDFTSIDTLMAQIESDLWEGNSPPADLMGGDTGEIPVISGEIAYSMAHEHYQCGEYEQAFPYAKVGSEMGDVSCTMVYGTLLMSGLGCAVDYELALECFQKAEESGVKEAKALVGGAMYALAYSYYYGDGNPQDSAKGAYWIKQSAERGDTSGIWLYGVKLAQGDGFKPDAHKGIELIIRAARLGHKQAVKDLYTIQENDPDNLYRIPNIPDLLSGDTGEMPIIKPATEKQASPETMEHKKNRLVHQNDFEGLFQLGLLCLTRREYFDAADCLYMCAEKGNVAAMTKLGILLYHDGWSDNRIAEQFADGTENEGMRWLKKAAALGDSKAAAEIERLNQRAANKTQSKRRQASLEWAESVLQNKNNKNESEEMLAKGLKYLHENSLYPAAGCLRKAAEAGNMEAMTALGMLLYSSKACQDKDIVKQYKSVIGMMDSGKEWLEKAASLGDTKAKKELARHKADGEAARAANQRRREEKKKQEEERKRKEEDRRIRSRYSSGSSGGGSKTDGFGNTTFQNQKAMENRVRDRYNEQTGKK